MFNIITKDYCPWCDKVKDFIQEQGFTYDEWKPDKDTLSKMARFFNFKTVPQIFYKGRLIGGYEDTVMFINNGMKGKYNE